MERDTRDKVAEVEKAFDAKMDELVKKILDRVGHVKPEKPRNLKKVEA